MSTDKDQSTNPETGQGYICPICDMPFTQDEWNDRHSGANDEEYHNHCCPICKEAAARLEAMEDHEWVRN